MTAAPAPGAGAACSNPSSLPIAVPPTAEHWEILAEEEEGCGVSKGEPAASASAANAPLFTAKSGVRAPADNARESKSLQGLDAAENSVEKACPEEGERLSVPKAGGAWQSMWVGKEVTGVAKAATSVGDRGEGSETKSWGSTGDQGAIAAVAGAELLPGKSHAREKERETLALYT